MASVLIPAHNEEASMRRTLISISPQISENIQCVVVCNGCTDDTGLIARQFEPTIKVIETAKPSKTNAINLGEELAPSFPYIYMDADVQLMPYSLEKIIAELESGQYLAVSPTPKVNLKNSNWFVKAYYDVWLSLPYSKKGIMGAGVYALSKEGRRRFGKFPDIIADDGYVRALFKEHERCNVEGAYAIVTAPSNLHWLVKIKTRSRIGQWQLANMFPELLENEEKDYLKAKQDVLKKPLFWPKVAVYLYVNFMSRLLAKRKMKDLDSYQWEKDISSRQEADN